jgi:hypothetical protein
VIVEKIKLAALLTLITPQIIERIVDEYGTDEITATAWLYESELYSQLERDETKLWHLSPLALLDLFREKRETGQITYPEEA